MAILRAHLRRRGGNARSSLLLLFAFIALAAVALEALFLPYFAPGLWSGGAAGHAASVPPHAQHAIAAQQQQRLASHGAAGGDPWFVKRRIGGERRSRTIRDGAKVRRSLFSSSHTLPRSWPLTPLTHTAFPTYTPSSSSARFRPQILTTTRRSPPSTGTHRCTSPPTRRSHRP